MEGNLQAIIKTPSGNELSIFMKDDKNGNSKVNLKAMNMVNLL